MSSSDTDSFEIVPCGNCNPDWKDLCETHCCLRKENTCKHPDDDEKRVYKCTRCPRRWHKDCVGFRFVEATLICPVCTNTARSVVTLYKNSKEEVHKCLCEEFTSDLIKDKVLPQIVRSVKVNEVPTEKWDQLSPAVLLASSNKPKIRIDIDVVNTKPTPWEGYTA
eukprot:PhF_6_TR818/c0_g1_i1/m.1244